MKPLIPTPYELGREAADKQEAALVKQAIADRTADKQRIRELETALGICAAHQVAKLNRVRTRLTDEALLKLIDAAILKGAK